MRHALFVALWVALGAALAPNASAAPGDTTWVHTFDQDFYNWPTPHYDTFAFPTDVTIYSNIFAFYTIGCPSFPDDCDPWDRLGHLRVVTPQDDIEIARVITPYDITGGGGPGTCTWKINVTAYKSLLHGTVTLRNYIESWIGGTDGWLVTVDFAFIEGALALEPYKVINLWQNDHVNYGDPDQPVPAAIPATNVMIDEGVDQVRVRVFTTGHGQGNTQNCAEFCPMDHSVVAAGTSFTHQLWNSNCSANPCSPQGGNWTFGRAGWCPGMDARAWNVNVTSAVTPGQMNQFEYLIEDYENFCRPSNPECVNGATCPDCNYNSTGHTQPHYTIQGQLILYKDRAEVVSVDLTAESASGVSLAQNVPNPFSPSTKIEFSIESPGAVALKIYDAAGRLVRDEIRSYPSAGTHSFRWDGRDASGSRVASGTYFYMIEADGESQAKKMVLVN